MKKENLTRKEALEAMVKGCEVRNINTPYTSLTYFFCEKSLAFRTRRDSDCEESRASMFSEDGYYIIEPEPKFKEVVMYSAIVQKFKHDIPRVSGVLESSKEYATRRGDAIGYTEVKVFLKEEQ